MITKYAQTMPWIPCTCNVLCQVVKNSFIEYVISKVHTYISTVSQGCAQ